MHAVTEWFKTQRGHDSITVFADKLTKRIHLVAGRTTDTAKDIADQYISNVFRHHGLQEVIISDRDTRFTSDFWTALCNRLRIRRTMSTAGHAQTDGQSERSRLQWTVVFETNPIRHHRN